MRPDARLWRKAARAALKGIRRGRRTTHKTETQEPRPGSTWSRRHPASLPRIGEEPTRPCQVGRCNRHDATRRPTSLYACPPCWAVVERLAAIYQAEGATA
jgi:hypothetical protein